MFRKKSLERLSSPEQLDALMRVIRRRSWLPLLAIGFVLGVVVVWSILGRIPVVVEGVGVLAHPRRVVPFQAPASGQLLTLDVHVGDVVEEGDLLGTLHLPDLQKQLEQEEQRLEEFRSRSGKLEGFDREQAKQERAHIQEQQHLIRDRIAKLEEMADDVLARNLDYIERQRANLETTRKLSEELGAALEERFRSYEELKAEGLSSADIVVDSRRRWIENRLRLAELAVEDQQVRLREIQAREDFDRRRDVIADLRVQIQALTLRDYEIGKHLKEEDLSTQSEIGEITRRIGRLRSQLESRSRIECEHRGRILEVTVSAGSIVQAGQRVGTLEINDPSSELVTLAYFPIREGKKMRAGLDARIAPATIPRERFGSILGSVQAVSDYPVTTDAAVNQIGNRELALSLTGGQSLIEVHAALQRDPATPSGFAWTSSVGPDEQITAGTTVAIRVTLARRAPITLLVPALRAWFGGE